MYTAPPPAPASINNEEDALESAKFCLSDLSDIEAYEGFLVGCYSVHPLVPMLKEKLDYYHDSNQPKAVIGIFEASVSAALAFLSSPRATDNAKEFEKFGIVSTGKYWEKALTDGVLDYMGFEQVEQCKRFKGVETTGLTASELHTMPKDEVRARMKEATRRLVKDGDVTVVCLGCAGMAGMDEMVKEACIEELGPAKGRRVRIVDGVKAGVGFLDVLARG
jgi:Asp/Glu/hydantoin racemase